jgi:hypothetical protein
MKSFFLFLAVLAAIVWSTSSTPTVTNAANIAAKERAEVKFDQPVRLMNIELKGDYLFVHDDAAMARGEACTYVYKGLAERPENLVVAFHCTPTTRLKAKHFTVRTEECAPLCNEITEFQFAGSSEGHRVPKMSQHTEHVTLAVQ